MVDEQGKARFFIAVTAQGDFKRIFKEIESYVDEIDHKSQIFNFNYTNYYEEEMGRGLEKVFLSLSQPLPREKLVDLKLMARDLEGRHTFNLKRKYNLDPGYLTPSQVVVATFKGHSHRIYLGRGVYAHLGLVFKQGNWAPLPWTHPDYISPEATNFFNRIRETFML